MARIIPGLLLILGLVLFVANTSPARAAAGWVAHGVKTVLALLMAIAGGALAGWGVDEAGGNTLAVMAAGLCGFLFLFLLLRPKRRAGRHTNRQPDGALPSSQEPALQEEAELAAAWNRLSAMVSRRDRGQIASARAECSRLLVLADGGGLDYSLTEDVVLLRRSLPELAQRSAALWLAAGEAEKAEISAGILKTTGQLAARARTVVDRVQDGHRDRLRAIHNHIETRSAPDG